ncbi:MAG: hypothetical protein ACJ74T_19605 [Pyrinomonadaceae bacterium]
MKAKKPSLLVHGRLVNVDKLDPQALWFYSVVAQVLNHLPHQRRFFRKLFGHACLRKTAQAAAHAV